MVSKLKTSFLLTLALLFFFDSIEGKAVDDPKILEIFDEEQARFNLFMDEDRLDLALVASEKLYLLGKQIFSEVNESRVLLAQNHGQLLIKLNRGPDARPFIDEALALSQLQFGDDSSKLIPLLINAGQSRIRAFKKGEEVEYFSRALKISKKTFGKNSIQFAETNLMVGAIITHEVRATHGKQYLQKAYNIIKKKSGTNSEAFGRAAFHLGELDLYRRSYKRSAKYLEESLAAFKSSDSFTPDFEILARSAIVNAYVNLNRQEEATEQCLAIGRIMSARPQQIYTPVVRNPPIYPRAAMKSGANGFVDLIFDVDELGFVENPKVILTKGHESFEKAALDAVNDYRYAPSFKNGESVKTKDVEVRILFELVK